MQRCFVAIALTEANFRNPEAILAKSVPFWTLELLKMAEFYVASKMSSFNVRWFERWFHASTAGSQHCGLRPDSQEYIGRKVIAIFSQRIFCALQIAHANHVNSL